MDKLKIVGIAGLLISIASFYLVKAPTTSIFSDPKTISKEILSQARKNLPEPVFPAKPAGKTVIEQKTVEHKIQVPSPTFSNPSRMTTKVVKTQVPIEKFVGPTTTEIQDWVSVVEQIKVAYEQRLEQEIKELESKKEEQFRSSLQSWATIFGGLVAGLGGIVSIVVSVRRDRREQEKHDHEMSKHASEEA